MANIYVVMMIMAMVDVRVMLDDYDNGYGEGDVMMMIGDYGDD